MTHSPESLRSFEEKLIHQQAELQRAMISAVEQGRETNTDDTQDVADQAVCLLPEGTPLYPGDHRTRPTHPYSRRSRSPCGRHLRRVPALRQNHRPQASGGVAVDALLHRLPGKDRKRRNRGPRPRCLICITLGSCLDSSLRGSKLVLSRLTSPALPAISHSSPLEIADSRQNPRRQDSHLSMKVPPSARTHRYPAVASG